MRGEAMVLLGGGGKRRKKFPLPLDLPQQLLLLL